MIMPRVRGSFQLFGISYFRRHEDFPRTEVSRELHTAGHLSVILDQSIGLGSFITCAFPLDLVCIILVYNQPSLVPPVTNT